MCLPLCLFAQVPFLPVDTNVSSKAILLPKGLRSDILFTEGEIIHNSNGKKRPSKGMHGFTSFISKPETALEGTLIVSHECNDSNKVLGDGGGCSIVAIKKIEDTWVTNGKLQSIDFLPVGGTCHNTGHALISEKKMLIF